MNNKIQLGVYNTLKISHFATPGAFLVSNDELEDPILLPNAYLTEDMKEDDILEVFVYTDSEDRLVATTQKPYALKDQFAFLKVIDTTKYGAFVDWGLPKDLFVPKNKQKHPFSIGDKRIIRIVEDERTNRLIGVEKITSFLSQPNKDQFQKNDTVEVLVFAKTDLGYKCIINDSFEGMLYHNEIFTKINVGDRIQAFIKQIREDKKIDLSLQKIGGDTSSDKDSIIAQLEANNGALNLTTKSDSDLIQKQFSMSKKAFKKALNELKSENKIEINEDGITLCKK